MLCIVFTILITLISSLACSVNGGANLLQETQNSTNDHQVYQSLPKYKILEEASDTHTALENSDNLNSTQDPNISNNSADQKDSNEPQANTFQKIQKTHKDSISMIESSINANRAFGAIFVQNTNGSTTKSGWITVKKPKQMRITYEDKNGYIFELNGKLAKIKNKVDGSVSLTNPNIAITILSLDKIKLKHANVILFKEGPNQIQIRSAIDKSEDVGHFDVYFDKKTYLPTKTIVVNKKLGITDTIYLTYVNNYRQTFPKEALLENKIFD